MGVVNEVDGRHLAVCPWLGATRSLSLCCFFWWRPSPCCQSLLDKRVGRYRTNIGRQTAQAKANSTVSPPSNSLRSPHFSILFIAHWRRSMSPAGPHSSHSRPDLAAARPSPAPLAFLTSHQAKKPTRYTCELFKSKYAVHRSDPFVALWLFRVGFDGTTGVASVPGACTPMARSYPRLELRLYPRGYRDPKRGQGVIWRRKPELRIHRVSQHRWRHPLSTIVPRMRRREPRGAECDLR